MSLKMEKVLHPKIQNKTLIIVFSLLMSFFIFYLFIVSKPIKSPLNQLRKSNIFFNQDTKNDFEELEKFIVFHCDTDGKVHKHQVNVKEVKEILLQVEKADFRFLWKGKIPGYMYFTKKMIKKKVLISDYASFFIVGNKKYTFPNYNEEWYRLIAKKRMGTTCQEIVDTLR